MASWGASRGNRLGYAIFIFILKTAGIIPAYALLRVVTLYYMLVPGNAAKPMRYYFRQRLGFRRWKTIWAMYQNFNHLGRSIIDKVVLMSDMPSPFTLEHDGIAHLDQMAAEGKGGLLISAHLGNWEAAGHLLKRMNTPINIVMYDGEHQKIKAYLDAVRERSFHVIVIREDISHIYEIGAALQRNEFVCIHADRYVEGNRTIETTLLGRKALLPLGPFALATTFKAPVSFVFAMKEGQRHFHFFASPGVAYTKGRQDLNRIVEDYSRQLESMIHRYPLQWHNYFPFWEEEKA